MPNSILVPTRARWFDLRFTEDQRKVKCECKFCLRPMWFPPSKAGKYVTCGGECAKAVQSIARAARSQKCKTCGKEFIARSVQLSKGGGRFCSQKCNTTSHEAMNSDAAQLAAREAWRLTYENKPFSKKGSENPNWKGGKQAKYLRDKESGLTRYSSHKRRSRISGGVLRVGDIKNIGRLQKWKCACCKVNIKDAYHIDHVIPISKGGANHVGNIQLLCPNCNLSKGAKDPIEFMQSRGFLL